MWKVCKGNVTMKVRRTRWSSNWPTFTDPLVWEDIIQGHYYSRMKRHHAFDASCQGAECCWYKVWDIGGQPRFRGGWERYCRNVDAIVYMVDAADASKLEASQNELHNLLDKPQLQSIPVLVLGNKRDLLGSMDEKALIETMNLSAIQDRDICCYSISCKEKDNIDITLQWLLQRSHDSRR
uniref:Uncharacterized protein n=1 Tax=Eptatretus burgeri TaxID=7764 RepID=A0A8C4X1L5_EPTBU